LKAFDRLNGDYYTFSLAEYDQLLREFGPELLSGFEQAALAFDLDRSQIYTATDFLAQVGTLHRAARQRYEQKRQELQVESKIKSVARGTLRVLKMPPDMRLEFLAELTASLDQSRHPFKIPLRLFPNLNWTARALQHLDQLGL